jgi:TRAP-type mannitol/chloroaromatic compound transport system permease small subunit
VAPEQAQKTGAPAARLVRAGIERLVEVVGEWISWLALVIVALMATNVLLRYLFRTGSVWSQELEWHLLAPLILFGMSYALRHGEHVRVDILYAKFSDRAKVYVDLLSALLCLALSVLVIWFSLHYVEQSYVIAEQSQDPGGLPYRFLLKALIPTGFALLLLQSIASALGSIEKLRKSNG